MNVTTLGLIIIIAGELFATGAQLDEARKIYSGRPSASAQYIEVDQVPGAIVIRSETEDVRVEGLVASRFDQAVCQDEAGDHVVIAGSMGRDQVLVRVGVRDGARTFFGLGSRPASRVVAHASSGACTFAVLSEDGSLYTLTGDDVSRIEGALPAFPDVRELRFGAALSISGDRILAGGSMGEFAWIRGADVLRRGRLDARVLPGLAMSDDAFWVLSKKGTLYRLEEANTVELAATSTAVGGLAVWQGHGLVWVDAQGVVHRWDGEGLESITTLGARAMTVPLVADFEDEARLQLAVMLESGDLALIDGDREDGYAATLVTLNVRANATPMFTNRDANEAPQLSIPTGLTSREVHVMKQAFASPISRAGSSLGASHHVGDDGVARSSATWSGTVAGAPGAPVRPTPGAEAPKKDPAATYSPSSDVPLTSCAQAGGGDAGAPWSVALLLGALLVGRRKREAAPRR